MVETSVAVATPSTTAARMATGNAKAGSATKNFLPIVLTLGRATPSRLSPRDFQKITTARQPASNNAGIMPAEKSAAMETPVTEPIVISTRLGGIVSDIAPDDA